MRPLFVTGTGTGIGKTLTSAAVLARFGDALDLVYVKPVQTGCPPDDDAASVARLTGRADRVCAEGVRLGAPVSPHLAAAEEGVSLTVDEIVAATRDSAGARRALVEGAGGILVPLNDHEMIVDLICELDAVVIVAADAGLGTINHTLLTLNELRRRDLDVAGVVLCGEPFGDNPAVIEAMGETTILGTIPLPEVAGRPDIEVVAAVAPSLDPDDVTARLCS